MYCHRLAPKANRMTGSARFSNFPGSISGVGTRDIGNGKGDSDRDVGIGNLSSSSRQKNILYYFYGDCTLRSGENVSRRNGLRRSLNGILRRNTDRKRERESLSRRFPVNSHHCLGSLPFFPHGDIKIFHVLDSSRRHKSWFQTKNAVNRDEHVERKRAMLVPRRTVRCRLT